MKKPVKLLLCLFTLTFVTIANANPKSSYVNDVLKLTPVTSATISPYFPAKTISYYYVSYYVVAIGGGKYKIYFDFYEEVSGSLVSANAPAEITVTVSDAVYGDMGYILSGSSGGGGLYVTGTGADITAVSPGSISGIPVYFEES